MLFTASSRKTGCCVDQCTCSLYCYPSASSRSACQLVREPLSPADAVHVLVCPARSWHTHIPYKTAGSHSGWFLSCFPPDAVLWEPLLQPALVEALWQTLTQAWNGCNFLPTAASRTPTASMLGASGLVQPHMHRRDSSCVLQLSLRDEGRFPGAAQFQAASGGLNGMQASPISVI